MLEGKYYRNYLINAFNNFKIDKVSLKIIITGAFNYMKKEQFESILPEVLQENLRSKSCGFFIGAGISMKSPSELPGWKKLLSDFIIFAEKNHKLKINIIEQLNLSLSNQKLLEVAEYLQGNLKQDYTRFLVEIFDNHMLKPNENHELLALIDSPLFITTNYDKLLENNMIANKEIPIVSTSKNKDKLEQIHRVSIRKKILKIHGDINESESLVLSETDYMETLDNQMLNVILKSYFHRYSFIFLGCSMTDPDVLIFLKQIKSIFKGYSPTHYALIKKGETNDIDEYIYKNIYNIEFIYIENHDDITDFLKYSIELQEDETKNAFEQEINEHNKLNYVEFLLQNLEEFNNYQDFYYDPASDFTSYIITEDLNYIKIIKGTFEEFEKINLYQLLSYSERDFKQIFDRILNMDNELLDLLSTSKEGEKEFLCESLNTTKERLVDFTNDVKNYIRYKRIMITSKFSKDDLKLNELMLEIYEKNYIREIKK